MRRVLAWFLAALTTAPRRSPAAQSRQSPLAIYLRFSPHFRQSRYCRDHVLNGVTACKRAPVNVTPSAFRGCVVFPTKPWSLRPVISTPCGQASRAFSEAAFAAPAWGKRRFAGAHVSPAAGRYLRQPVGIRRRGRKSIPTGSTTFLVQIPVAAMPRSPAATVALIQRRLPHRWCRRPCRCTCAGMPAMRKVCVRRARHGRAALRRISATRSTSRSSSSRNCGSTRRPAAIFCGSCNCSPKN